MSRQKQATEVFQAYYGLKVGDRFHMSTKDKALALQKNTLYLKVTNAWARLVVSEKKQDDGTLVTTLGDFKCMSPEIDVLPL